MKGEKAMNSFIGWIGGKNSLKKEIVKNFPACYKKYVEVFGGAGWVLFHKETKAGELEIYNDLNSHLYNLFTVVQTRLDEFLVKAEFCQNSREYFYFCKSNYNNTALSDVERAIYFYFLIKLSFGCNLRAFNSKSMNRLKNLANLKEINKRLNKVCIENLDFEKCITKFDKEDTFFYLDPPYYAIKEKYKNVPEMEHERLFNTLKNIKGKFLLSYNNNDYIKEMYKDFNIIETERGNNLVSRHKKREIYKELLIKNY